MLQKQHIVISHLCMLCGRTKACILRILIHRQILPDNGTIQVDIKNYRNTGKEAFKSACGRSYCFTKNAQILVYIMYMCIHTRHWTLEFGTKE